jgi:MFS family permease
MSSLSSLSAAILLLPGAMLVERYGRRRRIALLSGGLARLMLALLALIPLALGGGALVSIAIAFAILRDASGNLSLPAWTALAGDMVPLEGRGRYFGSRNIAIGVAGIAATLLAGELITRSGHPGVYQVAIGCAFILGMLSTLSFARLKDPKEAPSLAKGTSLAPGAIFRDLGAHPGFVAFAGAAALWNFSLNIAGPFFNVYMVQNLQASATQVGLASVASSVTNILVQRRLGELADRWGPRRLQLISSLLIPILPLAWVFVRSAWQIIPINLFSGVLWGIYGLASFTMLLGLMPENQRARFTDVYQVIVTVSLAGGAALGGLVVTHWGFAPVFIASGLGRFLAALLFARFVRSPEMVREPAMSG